MVLSRVQVEIYIGAVAFFKILIYNEEYSQDLVLLKTTSFALHVHKGWKRNVDVHGARNLPCKQAVTHLSLRVRLQPEDETANNGRRCEVLHARLLNQLILHADTGLDRATYPRWTYRRLADPHLSMHVG